MDRIDLNVPFSEKNRAKAAGARWDALHRTWYWPGDAVPDALAEYIIPGLRPDSAIMADVAAKVAAIVADLGAAYDRKIALIDIMALLRAAKIAEHKYAPYVIPILRDAGKEPVIRAAVDCLMDTVYGEHSTLPESGIASLDDFLMMAIPKTLRPVEALDRVSRIGSGAVVVAGMKTVFTAEIKKRNLL